MGEYIKRSYIRKMAMLETAYTMETETDAAVVLRMIDDAPSVDAVSVVRCKDCEYFNGLAKTSLLVDGKHVKAGWCDRRARWDEEYRMLPDDFCSYGLRRNDDHETD